jgi:hypothetical protein
MKESVAAVDPPGQERDAGALQLVFHELGVHGYVFEDEDAKRLLGHAADPIPSRVGGPSGEPLYLN